MKKIIAGLIGVVAVMAVTAGTAFAVFTTTATVNNVAFTTGTAGLGFATSSSGPFLSSYTFPTWLITKVFPGYTSGTQYIWLENTGDVPLAISAQLVSAPSGDWADLNSVTYMSINGVYGPLTNWNSADQPLGFTLAPGASTPVAVIFSIDHNAGNAIAGTSLVTNWVITGTQP